MANAIYDYDSTRGKLSTFAGNRIRGSMKRAVEVAIREEKGITIDEARIVRNFLIRVEKLTQKLQRVPIRAEVAEDLGIPVESVEALYQLAQSEHSLSKVLPGTENFTLGDTLSDGSNVEETVDLQMDSQEVRAALCKLEKIEMQVLLGIYYLGMTEAKIARKLGISVASIAYFREEGINHLRRILGAENYFEKIPQNPVSELLTDEIKHEIRLVVTNLSENYCQLLLQMYFYGKNQCQLAKQLGSSRQNIHEKHKNLLKYLTPLLDRNISLRTIAKFVYSL